MDEYGCYSNNPTDFDEIAAKLRQHGTIVFPYSDDRIGCMILLISGNFEKLGVMPFGGNPNGRYYVGIYGKGCNHISFDSQASYLREKFNLSTYDSETLYELFTELNKRM